MIIHSHIIFVIMNGTQNRQSLQRAREAVRLCEEQIDRVQDLSEGDMLNYLNALTYEIERDTGDELHRY